MNSGTRMGTNALARRKILPVSKSAPRAFCADMILSVSSISVGMNRSAMDIIMASSWIGRRSFFSGPSRLSMPSVRAMGLVVYVIKNVPMMSITIRSTICTAATTPSQVMLRSSQTSATGVPAVKNIFITAVKATTK